MDTADAWTFCFVRLRHGFDFIGLSADQRSFPAIAVQVSRDNGMTWQCYQIDTACWANGAMIEVEPDVVLYVYGALNKPMSLRRQLMQVTPDSLKPLST